RRASSSCVVAMRWRASNQESAATPAASTTAITASSAVREPRGVVSGSAMKICYQPLDQRVVAARDDFHPAHATASRMARDTIVRHEERQARHLAAGHGEKVVERLRRQHAYR